MVETAGSIRSDAGGRPRIGAVPDLDRPWEVCDPGRDRAMLAYTDADTARVIEEAVAWLVAVRAPAWAGDPGPRISVLVSLAGEAEDRVYDAVADAREGGYSWDQIASRLCTTVAAARRRYGGYARWRLTGGRS